MDEKTLKKLQELRKEIDSLDRVLFETLKQRFKLVQKVGKLKKSKKLPILQANRFEAMLVQRVSMGQKKQLDRKFVKSLMTLIHKESCRLQRLVGKEVGK